MLLWFYLQLTAYLLEPVSIGIEFLTATHQGGQQN
jgi:hypothetical protein